MKPLQLIEIPWAGTNCIYGTIMKEYQFREGESMEDYTWMIMVNTSAFGMIEDECKLLKINYIIFDRASAVIKIK